MKLKDGDVDADALAVSDTSMVDYSVAASGGDVSLSRDVDDTLGTANLGANQNAADNDMDALVIAARAVEGSEFMASRAPWLTGCWRSRPRMSCGPPMT